jgi:hypothetical protein
MSRLSDIQQQSAAVNEKVMERNDKAAGYQQDWNATKINVHKTWGVDPFAEAEKLAKRCIAQDAEQILSKARRMAAHIALDEALDEADDDEPEPDEEDEDAEPEEESEQKKMGGGCGRTFTCDSGQLITGRKSADEIRRLGLNFSVF